MMIQMRMMIFLMSKGWVEGSAAYLITLLPIVLFIFLTSLSMVLLVLFVRGSMFQQMLD